MKCFKYTLFIILATLSIRGKAQRDTSKRDAPQLNRPTEQRREFKPQRAVLLRFNYTQCIPTSDLAKRFASFSGLGGGAGIKFESGWEVKAEGSFLFGRNVVEYSVLDSLRNSDGYLVDQNGFNFNPSISMRGFTVGVQLTKLIPFNRNRNSGILVGVGGGFLQHKLHFQNVSSIAPQLSGDYLKGYDRLTNGYTINEFVGYQFMSIKRMVNFYLGVEFTQGNTQYARNWSYDQMGPDKARRSDNYWGIRLGWIIPIYLGNKGEDEFMFR